MARRQRDRSRRPATGRGGAGRRRSLVAIARRRGRGLWTVVAGLGTVVGLITGILALLAYIHPTPPRPPPPPSPMLGDVRLAVAPFDSSDARQRQATPASKTAALRTATAVADLLRSELAPLRGRLRVEVRPPAQLHPLGATSPTRQAEAAATLARQHGADILVHGTLVVDTASTRLEPHIYLTGGISQDADELTGDHKLGAAVITPGDPDSNPLLPRELAQRLATRLRALAALSVGVTYYHLDQLAEADRYLTIAGQTPDWKDSEGTELLHLFVGNVAARRGAELRRAGRTPQAAAQLTRALRAYQAALAVQPGYARALYGIAEARFLQLDLRCQPGSPEQAQRLQQVVAAFTAAGRAPYQPPGANLDLKVDLGLGRAYVCMTLSGSDHRSQATAHLSRVLTAVDPARLQTPSLTSIAAEAHAQLGLLALAEPGGPGRRARLQAAVGHFQRAIALSRAYPDRMRAFWTNLATVYDQLGDHTAAADARGQARASG